MLVSDLKYKNKYLKYKNKYLNLQSQIGGVRFHRDSTDVDVDIYNKPPIPPATLDDILVTTPTTPTTPRPFIQTIPDDLLMSIQELSNTVFDKKSEQLKDELTQTKLKEKLSKTTLDMFSTGNNIIINDKLNYREIYLLAKLFVNHIKLDSNISLTFFEKLLKKKVLEPLGKINVKDINISLDIFTNIFSLNILKTVLLNPNKKLLLTNNQRINDTNIHEHNSGADIFLFINPINDYFFDFQLNFIFFCIDIIKRNGDIILDFTPGTFVNYINSFKTIIHSLKQNIPVTKLKLWSNKISVEQIIALANALKINKTLKIIELDSIQFGYKNSQGSYDGAKAIADALKTNTTLTEINLNNNNIEDEGVKVIAEMLKNNNTLRILILEDNEFGVEGAKAIAEALKENRSLIKLNIQQNLTLGNEGIKLLADALKTNTTLKEINLRSTGFDNEGAIFLVEALKINKTLRSLYINNIKLQSMFKPYLSRVTIL